MKFTEKGMISVTAKAKSTASMPKLQLKKDFPGKYCIVFKVKDTGIGIEPSNLSYLFQPFVQANRDDRGTGLGLSTFHLNQINPIFRFCKTIF